MQDDCAPDEVELREALGAELSALRVENAQLRRRIDGLMTEKAEVIQTAKTLQRHLAKLRQAHG